MTFFSWRHVPLLILLFTILHGAYATNEVKAVYTDNPPKIDGRVSKDEWRDAAIITELLQRIPDTGDPVSEPTKIYILYDKNFIYIGMRCTDDPKKITANELARDVNLAFDDRVQIIFDTFLDRRNGYWFQIGPKGSIGDALVSENGAGFNKQWDGLWTGKAKINDNGWDAEVAIPFKTLNFKPGLTTWGMKIIRHIKRKAESAYWPVANLDSYKFQISDAGLLTGLEGITKGIGLDIRPYAITGIDNPPSENSNYIRNENPMFNIGGDVFYRVTPGIKAALTINTDFAQTEVDSRQINLTRFTLRYPEKRDFFLDGAQYFDFGISGERRNKYGKRNIPYFSRNIGLDENGNPIPITWGVKVTGQAGQWTMGLQNITDKPASNRNFTVGRIKRNFGDQSYVGVIATAGNAHSSASNQLAGLDLRLATAKFKGDKRLIFTAYGMKSFTDSLSTKDFSWGAELNYPNDFLEFRLGHQEIGENYLAGVGFVPRLGIRETYASAGLGPRPDKYGILQIQFNAGFDFITDFNNKLLTRDIPLVPMRVKFLSGDMFEFEVLSKYEYLNKDFNIYPKDSITIVAGTYNFWRYTIQFGSARRRRVWINPQFSWGSFFDGTRKDYVLAFGYKINTPIFVGLEYERNEISLTEGDFTTQIYRANANIFFNADISITNFVQYDNVSEKVGWQSRFRWIIKPGNEILLVWNSAIYQLPDDPRMKIQESTTRLKINYNFRF